MPRISCSLLMPFLYRTLAGAPACANTERHYRQHASAPASRQLEVKVDHARPGAMPHYERHLTTTSPSPISLEAISRHFTASHFCQHARAYKYFYFAFHHYHLDARYRSRALERHETRLGAQDDASPAARRHAVMVVMSSFIGGRWTLDRAEISRRQRSALCREMGDVGFVGSTRRYHHAIFIEAPWTFFARHIAK